jgi:hypothetical protein
MNQYYSLKLSNNYFILRDHIFEYLLKKLTRM